MDTDTYKEKWSVELSATNLFVWGGISIIILIVLTSLIIAFTPLRELIPGYTSNKLDVNGAKAKSTFELLNLTNNIQFGFYYNF